MKIHSIPPHDFWLALDAQTYFEAEYDPETIFHHGYARPLVLEERDVLAVVRFNEDPDHPVFDVAFPEQDPLSAEEEEEAEEKLRRILGADLDLRPLMEQADDDPVLGPLMLEHYGFKRVAKANLWEDAVDDIIRTRISHRPTAKRMVQDVRRTYGTSFEYAGTNYYSYPRPERVRDLEPEALREFGIARRKCEYIAGLGRDIVEGEVDVDELESMEPMEFYEAAQKIRGIGPSTAQLLMHFRNCPDAAFPSRKNRDGEEKGLRRWFIRAYGGDPNETSDAEFRELISAWEGCEALALRFLYIDRVVRERSR